MENKDAKKVVGVVTDFINTFSVDERSKEFIEEMSREHRTLQQSFTRLALRWIEYAASDEYQHDLRNRGTHELCKKIMTLFEKEMASQGYTGETLKIMTKISEHLAMV